MYMFLIVLSFDTESVSGYERPAQVIDDAVPLISGVLDTLLNIVVGYVLGEHFYIRYADARRQYGLRFLATAVGEIGLVAERDA